ncbi:MAG: DUF6873 family GME fold protein [Candidatus Omnitrophota bacterium]
MLLIHSAQIPAKYISKLKEFMPTLTLLPLAPFDNVYHSIVSHPDIFFFQINKNTLVHAPIVAGEFIKKLKNTAIELIPAEKNPAGTYPATASINAARVGKYIFHNTHLTDAAIKREAEKLNLNFVHCNQGYSRCSVIPVKEKALITCDKGIKKAAQENGIEALSITPGNIELPGEKHGFIGGASGVLPDGKIFFLGDITKHPDFEKIRVFLKTHAVDYLSLEGLPLYDVGTLIFLSAQTKGGHTTLAGLDILNGSKNPFVMGNFGKG